MVPEAPLEQTKHGLVAAGEGWFVLNAGEARWFKREGQGVVPGLQGRGDFRQLGIGLYVLAPGEPMAMYHWETDQEDFLVLSGEALLIIEGEERPLRQWDFVHCTPGAKHVIVGAGEFSCTVFAVGALEHHTTGARVDGTLQGAADWGAYTVDEAALRHGAGVEKETSDADEAYARFPRLVLLEHASVGGGQRGLRRGQLPRGVEAMAVGGRGEGRSTVPDQLRERLERLTRETGRRFDTAQADMEEHVSAALATAHAAYLPLRVASSIGHDHSQRSRLLLRRWL